MIAAGGGGLGLRDIRLDGGKLTYVATQENGVQQQCNLTLQKDGSFVGKCARTGGNLAVFDMEMRPPTGETTISKAQEEAPKEEAPKDLPKELPLGRWTGTRTPNNNANAVAQNVTFQIEQFPDPHGRWRIGPKLFVIANMIVNAQQRFPLSNIRLEGETLSLVIEQAQPNQLQCTLERQKDGSFAGNCPRIRDKQAGFKVTMVPPKETTTPDKK
jgi:hypothetical protein